MKVKGHRCILTPEEMVARNTCPSCASLRARIKEFEEYNRLLHEKNHALHERIAKLEKELQAEKDVAQAAFNVAMEGK
jgi:vacuolar-type H+-ATPase subunit D/Vma8